MRPHLCEPSARKALMAQFVGTVRTELDKHGRKVRTFAEICEVLRIITLKLDKANLGGLADLQAADSIRYKMYLQGYQKFCNHHWRPEDIRRVACDRFKGNNSGCLLWGERGSGKSQILSYLTAWAHEKQWVSFTISDPDQFVGGKGSLFRYKNGLYFQFDLAKSILEDFRHSNE